jgi:hypothetical protein
VPVYTHRQHIDAPREVVFDVLADRLGYAEITPLRSVTLLSPGEPDAQGVGAVHRLSVLGPIAFREQVTLVRRPDRFEYRVVGGVPVRRHTAVVTLATSATAGTELEYTMDSTPSLPLPGFMVRPVLKLLTRTLSSGIADESVRRAATD